MQFSSLVCADLIYVNGEVPKSSGQDFFANVKDGCFNLLCSFMTDLEDYKSLQIVIHKNKQCESHWLKNLRKYAHRAEQLFDEFTSLEILRFVLFDRKIDVRGWELHLEGPNENEHMPLNHNDSFFRVCQGGKVDIARAIVDRTQVDLETRAWGSKGMTPLLAAASYGHLSVVQCLCEQGAVKEARDDAGMTPLLWAASYGHFSVVQCLCEQGANKEARNNAGWTPLYYAAHKGHLPVVQYLCEQRADKEARDDGGWTPLLWAAGRGHLPIVQYLCEQGADKEARDGSGLTPLDFAARKAHHHLIRYLQDDSWSFWSSWLKPWRSLES